MGEEVVAPKKLKPIPRPPPSFPQRLKKKKVGEVLEFHLNIEAVVNKPLSH